MNCNASRVLSTAVAATTIVFCSVFFGCSSNHTEAQREVLRTVRSSEMGNGWCLLLHERDIVSLNVSDSALQHLYPEPGSSVRPAYLGMASLNPAGDKMVFSESPDLLSYSLTIFDLRTHERESLSELPYIQGPRWSPDGNQIAFEGKTDHTARNGSLYLYHLGKGAYSIIIEEDLKSGGPLCWAPDGRKIVYQSGDNKIRVFDLASRLTRTLDSGETPTWSPNGRYIAYQDNAKGYVLYDLQNERKTQILQGESVRGRLIWSPDNRFIAYSKPSTGIWSNISDAIAVTDSFGDLYAMDVQSGTEVKLYRHDGSIYPSDCGKIGTQP